MKTVLKRILILLTAFSLGTAAVHIAAEPVLGLGAPRDNMPVIGALEKADELGYTLLDAYREVKDYTTESVKLLWDHKGKLLGFSVGSGLVYSFGLARFVPVIKCAAKVTVVPATLFFGWPIAKVGFKLANEWMVKPAKKYFSSTPQDKVVKTEPKVEPKKVDAEKIEREAQEARLAQMAQQEQELAKRQEMLDAMARDAQKAQQEAQEAAQQAELQAAQLAAQAQAQQQVTPRASNNNRRQAVQRGNRKAAGRRR